jgi:hypothetical protein
MARKASSRGDHPLRTPRRQALTGHGEATHLLTGRWSGTYQEWGGGSIEADGHCSWAFVHEGDTWKIRRDTRNITPWNRAATPSQTTTPSNQIAS